MHLNSMTAFATGTRRAAAMAGFTLIEVLIALLILAIGVLGVAALQFKGLRYSHDANIRSQINFLAWDLADRMRLNRANAAAYTDADLNPYTSTGDRDVDCDNSVVDAETDMACWHDLVDMTLPAGSTATVEGPNNTVYTVRLSWTDRENDEHVVEYSFQP